MKKYIILIILLTITVIAFAQDQTINGMLTVNPGAKSSYTQGIRIYESNDKWSIVTLGAIGTSGTSENTWIVGRSSTLNFMISRNSSNGLNGMVITKAGNVGFGTATPQYKLHAEGEVYTTGWYRVNGNKGFYFQSWGGGFNMTDANWIRTYGNKGFYHNTGIMRTDGVFHVGSGGNRFIVNESGNVGIGVTNPTSKLEVNGTIRAKEVKIEATGWSDFVFDKNYNLPKLSDVEKHISEKQHLPGIPSEKEVLENGVNVVDMQAKLLQKIEELTLYVIEQDKQIKSLKTENREIKSQLNNK